MQSYLVRACSTHTLPADLTTAPLRLPTLGLGLPALGFTCHAAYAAQLQTNLRPSIQALTVNTQLSVEDFLKTDLVTEYRGALQYLIQHTAILDRYPADAQPAILQWASTSVPQDPHDVEYRRMATAALLSAP